MNLVVPFFGGMPTCHGAGGLAGQDYFGARTGGANILEEVIEMFLGLFLAASLAQLLRAFPAAIIGAMLFLVGVELRKLAKDVRGKVNLAVLCLTMLVSVVASVALGFVSGGSCPLPGSLVAEAVSGETRTRAGLAQMRTRHPDAWGPRSVTSRGSRSVDRGWRRPVEGVRR
jgi:hypothetical protein